MHPRSRRSSPVVEFLFGGVLGEPDLGLPGATYIGLGGWIPDGENADRFESTKYLRDHSLVEGTDSKRGQPQCGSSHLSVARRNGCVLYAK